MSNYQYQPLGSKPSSIETVNAGSCAAIDERKSISSSQQPYSPMIHNHPYHPNTTVPTQLVFQSSQGSEISGKYTPEHAVSYPSGYQTPAGTQFYVQSPMALGYQQVMPQHHFMPAQVEVDMIVPVPQVQGALKQPSFHRKPTKMVKKEVVLTDGNFVVDTPLGDEYINNVYYKAEEEFTTLRYTAAVTDPNQFNKHYNLRQNHFGRKTKLAVVCTMYNEDENLFTKTIAAVMDNISYLCSLKKKGWSADSWKEIVVVIVADGVKPMNKRTLDVLSAMGCFVEGLPKSTVNDKQVEAHVFEFTTQVRIDQDLEARFVGGSAEKYETPVVPMQTVFLLKEKNAKKINSHRWFFNSICSILKPEVCVLLDVGTRPTKKSFYYLYRAFERNPNVAGACGEIAAELGETWRNLLNPLVAIQNFEYKMSNILDKPFESVCGYISVLPGAFSAYRYQALLGRPLESYFKGEKLHAAGIVGRPNVSESNMYLAEDRILCFELVMKLNHRYVLKYVKNAKAETDVPTELHDLIKQRRRWFNGSFFASTYAVQNTSRILSSGHYPHRKLILLVETLYNTANLIFSWFNIANMYICFWFMFNIASADFVQCTQAVKDAPHSNPFYPYGSAVSGVVKATYMIAFITMVLVSLGNKPDTVKSVLIIISLVFAICMALMLILVGWTVFLDIEEIINAQKTGKFHGTLQILQYISQKEAAKDLVISLMCTYLLYFLSSLLYLDPWHTVTCMLQYLLMIPTFVNVLMVYAFCNIHDISWGTKGQDNASHAPAVKSKKNDRGQEVVATDVPAPSYSNELEKLSMMSYELRNPPPKERAPRPDFTSEDHFKNYRTYVLVAWFLSNFILAVVMTDPWIISKMQRKNTNQTTDPNPFLTFLLWAVAGLTSVRFVGAFIYWLQWIVESMVDAV
ncbi:chitin synthase-domain-containing protein [Chytriomyces sp. MP71]|nr:chitin synthase-domain-containing protein [Chytriomyces sp. MP71]